MKHHLRTAYALSFAAILLLIGTIFFHRVEGWTPIDSLYFSVVSLTTVGYGDITPKTDIAKLFTTGYILMGISLVLYILSNVVGAYMFEQQERISRVISKVTSKLHKSNNSGDNTKIKQKKGRNGARKT